jgi:hypothetical protein
MGQRIILSEEEKLTIQKMYGLISEQDSSNEPDVNNLLDTLGNLSNVEDKLLSFLTKTENELYYIGREEMVNQVMNTNETNSKLLQRIDNFWRSNIKGTEFEERYKRQFEIIKGLIFNQKINDNDIHTDLKWLKDILFLSKSEFKDFVRNVKNLEDLLEKYNITKDMVVENKDKILKQLKYNSGKVPKDLQYRIRPIGRLIDYNFIESTGPRPTADTNVRIRN